MRWNNRVWKGIIVVLGLMTVSSGLDGEVRAQSATNDAQLTILVRDADGNPLPLVVVYLYRPQPPAEPQKTAETRTGFDGKVTIDRLDATQTYVLQFQSGVPIILDGRNVGSRPIQFYEDQNAGREINPPGTPPGFPIQFGDQKTALIRFVIGGTFSDAAGRSIAAVPMFDLAETDDAPVRAVNPLTGDELTPEQARTFHAVIGEPWGVVRGGEASPDALTSAAAAPFASVEAVPLPSAAAGGTTATPAQPATPGSAVTVLLVVVIVLLVAVIGGLLLRQRGKTG